MHDPRAAPRTCVGMFSCACARVVFFKNIKVFGIFCEVIGPPCFTGGGGAGVMSLHPLEYPVCVCMT